MIIGLTGKKGCGKSSAAISMRDYHGYTIASFAEPLKRTMEAFGVPRENMETPGLKEEKLPEFGNHSARKIMQLFGTEFARNLISENIWINKMRAHIKNLLEGGSENIVIDDVRFNNEADSITQLGGVIFEVVRPDVFHGDDHLSERGVSASFITLQLENISCYETDLNFSVTNALEKLYV